MKTCQSLKSVGPCLIILQGGSDDGKKSNPDTISRTRSAEAVLDFAKASQQLRNLTMREAVRPRRAMMRL
jgi:hypothetical protein